MKDVNEGKVGEILQPEHGDGGEEGLGDSSHGQGDDAAHQEGEQGPAVEQGRVLPKCKQVSSVPVNLFYQVLIIGRIEPIKPYPKLND